MDEKFILKSKTIIGSILLMLRAFNVELPFADSEFDAVIDNAIAVVGFVLVVWGRMTASGSLGFNPNK